MKNDKISMKIESRVMDLADGKRGVMYLYDDICPDEYDRWNDEVIISATSEKFIRDRLAELEGVDMLDIHISSRGGYVQTGMNLYAQIKAFSCAKKTAYIDGMAASIATVVAMAADEVVMNEAGLMMIHSPFVTVKGNAAELRKAADDLDVIGSAAMTAYLSHAGEKLTREGLLDMMSRETWLTASQCLEYGLCDRIEDGKRLSENAPAQFLQSVRHKKPETPEIRSDGAEEEIPARLDRIEQDISDIRARLDRVEQEISAATANAPDSATNDPDREQAAKNRVDIIAAALSGLSNLF